ncbi:MAG TPA: thioredoxin family protein [Candidatus Limnocylindrales bacterium]|nr:thioredoxin family protein [Candidatus Limnocylindrales bacterium]
MNKNTIIGIVIAVIVLGGGLVLINNQSSKSFQDGAMVKDPTDSSGQVMMKKEDSAMEKADDEGMMKKDPSVGSEQAGTRYVEYSKADLTNNTDKRRVLYFYASWCPTCRIADPELSANANKFPEDVVVLRVNYNDPDTDQEEKDLARKYAVTYQHTFVQIDGEGNEVTTWNGGQTDELLAKIK